MAEEKARFESQEHDDHSNPMLFDIDVSTSVLDQDRLTKENTALRRENAESLEEIEGLEKRYSEFQSQLDNMESATEPPVVMSGGKL